MNRLILREINEELGANPLQKLGLTERQAEVLHWITIGKRDEEIGLILRISTRTVNNHVQAVLRQLRVETRTAAALAAFECLK